MEGKDPNKDELDGLHYTYGATEGYITVKPGELPAGKYFCALYINDSYDEVSERIYITISDKSANRIETEKESLSYTLSGGVLSLQNNSYDTAEIFQTTGKRVIHTFLVSGNNRIDMNDLENGLYILRVSDKEKARSYKNHLEQINVYIKLLKTQRVRRKIFYRTFFTRTYTLFSKQRPAWKAETNSHNELYRIISGAAFDATCF